MRIGCIGNMNNNMFAIVRYLRDLGAEAELLMFPDEPAHFHPSSDSFDLDFTNYTSTLDWGRPYDLGRVSRDRIRADLERFDVLVGCGAAPAYLHKAGLRLDVFIPYGTDILYLPFQKLVRPHQQFARCRFSHAQAEGIREARYVQLDRANDVLESPYERLRCRGKRLCSGVPMVYTGVYDPESIGSSSHLTHWAHEFQKIRDRHELVVFHQTRHVWRTQTDAVSLKATDQLLQGFAELTRRRPRLEAALVLLEYGPDVRDSKRLIRELGIENKVGWFPLMTRKDLLVGLNMADIGTGEFHNSWLSCGTIYESLAMAKPLLHYRRDDEYEGFYPELYPLMNARRSSEIADRLDEYVDNPNVFQAMGRQGRDWYQKYVVQRTMASYESIIQETLPSTTAMQSNNASDFPRSRVA